MTAPMRRTRKTRVVEPATVDLPMPAQDEAGTEDPGSSSAPDLEAIFPDPSKLTILGISATVRRLQTREIMAGIRILVDQLGSSITEIDLDALRPTSGDDDEEAQAKREAQKQHILGMLLVAAPDAADEILKLISGLVEARDATQQATLEAIMFNPPPAVTLDVIGVVIEQERDDLTALVGKARQMFGFAQALQRTQRAGT